MLQNAQKNNNHWSLTMSVSKHPVLTSMSMSMSMISHHYTPASFSSKKKHLLVQCCVFSNRFLKIDDGKAEISKVETS